MYAPLALVVCASRDVRRTFVRCALDACMQPAVHDYTDCGVQPLRDAMGGRRYV